MNRTRKSIFFFFFVLAAASGLCLILHSFDNKYTSLGSQPLEGHLVLSGEELDTTPVHFLIHGWAFYPEVLLTPGELSEENKERYMVYTSIGEHSRFGLNKDKNPHGLGTYVLQLHLPDTISSYALELPEIYSAYKLYINETLKVQVGNPEPETYLPRTQNRIVTFEAGGSVTLLLAVSDYSHFYSGLVYPPAFGTPENVIFLRSTRLIVAACLSLISLLGALFACYLGLRMKHHNAVLFALLCLTAMMFSCYQLLHTALLPVHPWYAIEATCGYLLGFFVIILQNRLCHIQGFPRYYSEITAGVFCMAAFLYGMLSPLLTVPAMDTFSLVIFLYKIGTALYLLAVSFSSLKQQNLGARPLFYASLFYGVVLLWDRFLPAYEPIFTGWFSEWGSFVMILVIGYTLWSEIVEAYSIHLSFAEEHRQTKRQLAMQLEYANKIQERSQEHRKLIHDFRHHLRAIQKMAALVVSQPETKEQQQELLTYLESFPQITAVRGGLLPNPLCNRTAVDALLQYFDSAASRQGISADLILTIPEGLSFSDIDWCTVLGNLLENALEACAASGKEAPILRLSSKWTGRAFFLLIENTYSGQFLQKNGHFLSQKRKHKEFGIGLESVRETVQLHGGTLEIYPLETVFQVGISLPAKP